jgi:2-polyprenyl-3-methyl-5-hydroxy-6-metoxy-1,4-benzoquinol methylase
VIGALQHIHARRHALLGRIDTVGHFEQWEESCVPSYCHPNLAAAYVSWWRLYRAVALARRHCPAGRTVLDFGASVGELARLLPATIGAYDFVESHEAAARLLMSGMPHARRRTLADGEPRSYDWIFAIDSLEHNENYADLLEALAGKLTPGGVLVLSGPTENWLYRLGRTVAGFAGHYHKTTIFHIEEAAGRHLMRRGLSIIIPGLPLFRLSAWSRRA